MADAAPEDDKSIADDQFLYRRIFPRPDALIPVEGGYRPMSGALQDKDQATSVDLAAECHAEDTRDRDTSQHWHVARIPVAAVRAQQGCRVIRRPKESNPAHAVIYGKGKNGYLTDGPASNIAKQSRIFLLNPLAPAPKKLPQ